MTIRMDNLEGLTLAEMKEMVANNRHLGCEAIPMNAAYPLIERALKRQQYRKLSKGRRGVVLRFLAKVIGRSRARMTRLVRQWMSTELMTIYRHATKDGHRGSLLRFEEGASLTEPRS